MRFGLILKQQWRQPGLNKNSVARPANNIESPLLMEEKANKLDFLGIFTGTQAALGPLKSMD